MPTAAPVPEKCLCALLRRAARRSTRFYDEAMRPSGLKVTQFSLLRNIGRAGSINVTELARLLELDRTAMGRNLEVLRAKGFLRDLPAKTSDDQRARTVTLTAAGQRALEAALPTWRAAQAAMLRRVQDGEFGALREWLGPAPISPRKPS